MFKPSPAFIEQFAIAPVIKENLESLLEDFQIFFGPDVPDQAAELLFAGFIGGSLNIMNPGASFNSKFKAPQAPQEVPVVSEN